MKILRADMLAAVLASLAFVASASAETKVTLSGAHLCCGACLKAVGEAVKGVEGASVACDKDAGTITVTAADNATAQKAVNALARAGFYGKSSSDEVKIGAVKGLKEGKVSRLVIAGVHNCCPGCCRAIKQAVKSVDGVEADTAKPKARKFVVEGNFDAAALVAALRAAGFNPRIAKK